MISYLLIYTAYAVCCPFVFHVGVSLKFRHVDLCARILFCLLSDVSRAFVWSVLIAEHWFKRPFLPWSIRSWRRGPLTVRTSFFCSPNFSPSEWPLPNSAWWLFERWEADEKKEKKGHFFKEPDSCLHLHPFQQISSLSRTFPADNPTWARVTAQTNHYGACPCLLYFSSWRQ